MTGKQEIVEDAVNNSRLHHKRRWIWIPAVLGFALLVGSGFLWFDAYRTNATQAERGTSLAQQVKEACADTSKYTEDLRDLCGAADDVVDKASPNVLKGDPGQQGEQGKPGPGPSPAQVRAAVASYCADGNCDGEDGQDASPAQVAKAVAAYCNAQGECRGPSVADGSAGSDGATGPQGPPPTASQVAAAVEEYCRDRDGCRGRSGSDGKDGKDGKDGTLVQSGACEFTGLGTIRITLQTSDGAIPFECTGIGPVPDSDNDEEGASNGSN